MFKGHEELEGFLPSHVPYPAFRHSNGNFTSVEDPHIGGVDLGKKIVQIRIGTMERIPILHAKLFGPD
jgi:hypothetical protein